MVEGRTHKVIRNSKYAVCMKMLETVLAFILRTIFVQNLSTAYLGVNGVFANILTVLSLMDLGAGSAISFALYETLAQDNKSKVVALMDLYRKLYRNIGLIIWALGLALTPLLKYVITLPENIPNIYIIYWLNIANTVMTYFLAYKRTLLIADQKSYVNYQNAMFFKITRFIILAIVLIVFHSFILYLALDILNTLVSNVAISIKVSKMYPYLSKTQAEQLPAQEKQRLWKYMKAGLLNKVGQTVVTSTDNVIISAFISTITVGLYSNYLLVINGIENVVFLVFSNVTSSVGNLAASKNVTNKKTKNIFNVLQMVNHVISTISCVGLGALLNDFIELWLGADYLLSHDAILICVANLYITLNTNSVSNFMGARGEMYYLNRYRPLVEAIINLFVSLSLVRFTDLGITGVFIGTTVSFMFGRIWMDAKVLFNCWFHEKYTVYIKDYMTKFGITTALYLICSVICRSVREQMGLSLFSFILMIAGTLIICCVTLILVYRNKESYKYVKQMILVKLRKGAKE